MLVFIAVLFSVAILENDEQNSINGNQMDIVLLSATRSRDDKNSSFLSSRKFGVKKKVELSIP